MVNCKYCKEPVTAQLDHPNVGRNGGSAHLEKHWMTYCEDCDVWSVIPMLTLVK